MEEQIERHGNKAWRTSVAGALTALSLLATPIAGWAQCKVQSLELPVTLAGSRAVAKVGINGTPVSLFVDSGAFFSFLTPAAAQQLKLRVGSLPWGLRIMGLTGEVEAGATTVDRLQLMGGDVPDVDFVVGGNDDNSGTMGLIGRNILSFADTEYDLAHGVIRLMVPTADCRDKNMAYWAGDKPISTVELLRDDNNSKTPAIRAVVELNGKKQRALFDTGAQSTVFLKTSKSVGIVDMTPAGKRHGGGRGEADSWTANVDRFEIGGEAISNIRMAITDFEAKDADMLLGIDFFLSHRIYVAKKQRRMYFTYNGGPVFALSAVEMAKAHVPAFGASDAQPAGGEEPTDAAGYARRGAASAARLDFTHALTDLDRACEMEPQVADYFVQRGVVREHTRRSALALKDFDTALQLDPSQSQARLHRAWLRVSARNRDGALEDLQALDKALAPQAAERIQVAAVYERLNLSALALPQYTLWIAGHADDETLASVLNSRCWDRAMLNIELEPALDDCNRAIRLHDKEARYYDSRAWLQLRRGELALAMADFDRAVQLKPDEAWSLYGRGIVHRKLGEIGAGQADIDAARKLQPSIDEQTGRHGLSADPMPASPAASGPSGG